MLSRNAMEARAQWSFPARTTKYISTAHRDRTSIDWSWVRFCGLLLTGLAVSIWFWAKLLAA